jgi:hypothetical protein
VATRSISSITSVRGWENQPVGRPKDHGTDTKGKANKPKIQEGKKIEECKKESKESKKNVPAKPITSNVALDNQLNTSTRGPLSSVLCPPSYSISVSLPIGVGVGVGVGVGEGEIIVHIVSYLFLQLSVLGGGRG